MIKNILFPIDLEHESSWKPVIDEAVDLARNHGATLHVMTVTPKIAGGLGLPAGEDFGEDVPSLETYQERMRQSVAKRLESFVREKVPDELRTQHWVGLGSVYREILRVAEETHADLIILSAYRPSLRSYLLGTNAERVVRHADCSVYVVRP